MSNREGLSPLFIHGKLQVLKKVIPYALLGMTAFTSLVLTKIRKEQSCNTSIVMEASAQKVCVHRGAFYLRSSLAGIVVLLAGQSAHAGGSGSK